jgi:hypothetical protein
MSETTASNVISLTDSVGVRLVAAELYAPFARILLSTSTGRSDLDYMLSS